jgi:hypothetical protein
VASGEQKRREGVQVIGPGQASDVGLV